MSLLDQIAAEISGLATLASPSDGSGYGIDLVCVSDLDSRLAETRTDSIQSLSQDLFHRITTPRGTLFDDDPNYGIDIRGALSRGMTPIAIAALQGQIEAECRKDDRVADIKAIVTVTGVRLDSWNVTLQVLPANPNLTSFALILAVTDGQALFNAITASPR